MTAFTALISDRPFDRLAEQPPSRRNGPPGSLSQPDAGNENAKRSSIRPWSEADREVLRALRTEGLPATEIARRLDRSEEAVNNMCRRLNLRRREAAQAWNPNQLRTLKRMLEAGSSLQEIAATTGHPRSSVADKLRRLELKSRRFRQPWSQEELKKVQALYEAGGNLAALRTALPGRSTDAIQQKLQELVGRAPFRSARRGQPQPEAAAETAAEAPPPASTLPAPTAAESANTEKPLLPPSPVQAAPETPGGERSMPAASIPAAAATPPPSPPLPRRPRFTLVSPPAPIAVPGSTEEMIRWLRSRDFMVVHHCSGWKVDHHLLGDEPALREFVNTRRLRLNLPPFMHA
jgi:hypothetical protein